MKKIIVSACIIIGFAFYALFQNRTSETTVLPTSTSTSTNSSSSNESTNNSSTSTAALYKDGTYTGSVADAFYGNIQVKATIQNGKLTDVEFLQYPNDHHESIEINTNAMPILKQEAIAAQSADVDGVTRATDTTNAFKQSLASALTQAKN